MAIREQPLLRRTTWRDQVVRLIPRPISPLRVVLAVIAAAFVLAMVWMQQTQSLVRVGGEVQRFELRLDAVELERQGLLADLAVIDDLPSVTRTAFTDLDMRHPSRPVFMRARPLPPGVSFDLPLWAAPPESLRQTSWWEAIVRAIGAEITSVRE